MALFADNMEGKHLSYAELIAPNGLDSGANPASKN